MSGATESVMRRLHAALGERGEIIFAYLFGSVATGATHRFSDVDVAVYVEPDAYERLDRSAPYGYLAEITGVVSEALDDDDVNVVALNDAPPLLADRVARDGRLILSRDDATRQDWLVRTKSRYCDLRYLRRLLRRGLEQRLRAGRFGVPG